MYEWDEQKNQLNIEKHGVSFQTASGIFENPTLTMVDDRADYGEDRKISIGMVENIVVLAVVHTDRNGNTRLISTRRANRKERARYGEEIQKRVKP